MRVLVVGANGLLGSQVLATAAAETWTVAGTYHSTEPEFDCDLFQLDIRDETRFGEVIDHVEPDWVINCAAMTDVDECEKDERKARTINGEAPGALARCCRQADAGFVHVSTDYVFNGMAREPYAEDADPHPLQTYGKSKLEGEQAVRASHDRALVTRLSFVYGIHGATGQLDGFPAWVMSRIERGEEISLFTDQWVTPTRAGLVADVILALIDVEAAGTYHVASRSCVTPHEFGTAVATTMGMGEELLNRSSIDEVERPARRPRYTCLDVSCVEDEIGRRLPGVQSDLDVIADTF